MTDLGLSFLIEFEGPVGLVTGAGLLREVAILASFLSSTMTVFPFLVFDSVVSRSEFSPGSVMLFKSKYSLMKGGIFLKSGKWSPLLFPKPRKNRKKVK